IRSLQAGASGSSNPTTINGTSTSVLTVATSASTPSGDTPSVTVTGTSGSLPQVTTGVDLFVSSPSTQTGVGCQVAMAFSPAQPVAGQLVTYSATLSGIPPGNTQFESANVDGQPLCDNSSDGGSSCLVTQTAPAAGTHALQWSCSTSGPGGNGTGSGTQT